MEFITIYDKTTFHYCQWTGNEVELEKFRDAGYPDLEFFMTPIPESAVDYNLVALPMFDKHMGEFTFEVGKKLKECFHEPAAHTGEPDYAAWVENALAGLTHITEMDFCVKCKKVISNEVPVNVAEYEVSCRHCNHSWTKSCF